jgi:squalene synthase HpnC
MSLDAIGTAGADARRWLLDADVRALARRARTENFPVASLLLPKAIRADVAAVYAAARLIDEAGDSAPGDRLEILDLLAADLRRDTPVSPILRAVPAGQPRTALLDLVGANQRDQTLTECADRAALRDYCRLSAEPIGRIVLHLFGLLTPERQAWSDDVCAGLQVAEHLQDVGEDLAAGRVYLPADAMARHGVDRDLLAAVAARTADDAGRARVAALLAGQVDWARQLLAPGRPLVRSVPVRAKLAIAGFTAGGLAALDAVLAAGADAVWATPEPRRAVFARRVVGVLR